jgi:1-acyl-sn-glycerol-3-phosphate acyltransferase
MSFGTGEFRAANRLARLALLTAAHLSRVASERDLRSALQRGHSWAGQILDAVGVRVLRAGPVPEGPVLIVANHRSYIDIPVMLAQLPCTFLAKREIARWPLFGRAAAGIHTVFVDRACPRSRASARLEVVQRLKSGLSVTVFPAPVFPGPVRGSAAA